MMEKVYNKDIMHWDKFPNYDIIWCDPPWGQRMVNFFESLMLKNGQPKPNNSITAIIKKLGNLAYKSKPLFVEYSVTGSDLVIDILKQCGHNFCNKVSSIQSNGKPYVILVFNTENYTPDGSKCGFDIIDSVCYELNFTTVFDPFAGIGKTGKRFIKNRKTYIGSEINSSRFVQLKNVIWAEQ